MRGTLYYAPPSPFARKVMIAAIEFGLEDAIDLVPQTVTPVSENAAVIGANPLGKIPALVLDDGTALFDSRVIVAYLAAQRGGGPEPTNWPARAEEALVDGLLDAAVLLRYETGLRPQELQWADWIAGQRGKVLRALDELETRSWASGEHLGIAACGMAAALGYLDFRFPDLGWRERRPRLAGFLNDVAPRRSMRVTAPERDWRVPIAP